MAKAQAQEPSMEEILASIRRIIADEDTAPKGAKAAAPAPVPEASDDETISEEDLDKLFASADEADEEEDEDVLDLTEELAEAPAAEPPMVEGLEDVADIAFADEPEPEPEPEPTFEVEEPTPVVVAPEPPPAPKPAPVATARPVAPPPPAPPAAAAEPAFETPPLISDVAGGVVANAFNDLALTVLNRNARTLEDLVQEMLRPMLKTWLDQNLPGMVERLVRAEIERVTRGR
ncbi:MAG: DUF2497 domain-containing protein [Hyphomicrobiales bacterium]|nr:DUF2497 domain-containing protein [Hyphomicrobiales bacterium]